MQVGGPKLVSRHLRCEPLPVVASGTPQGGTTPTTQLPERGEPLFLESAGVGAEALQAGGASDDDAGTDIGDVGAGAGAQHGTRTAAGRAHGRSRTFGDLSPESVLLFVRVGAHRLNESGRARVSRQASTGRFCFTLYQSCCAPGPNDAHSMAPVARF